MACVLATTACSAEVEDPSEGLIDVSPSLSRTNRHHADARRADAHESIPDARAATLDAATMSPPDAQVASTDAHSTTPADAASTGTGTGGSLTPVTGLQKVATGEYRVYYLVSGKIVGLGDLTRLFASLRWCTSTVTSAVWTPSSMHGGRPTDCSIRPETPWRTSIRTTSTVSIDGAAVGFKPASPQLQAKHRDYTVSIERDKGFEPSTCSLGMAPLGSNDQQVGETTKPATPDSDRKVLLRLLSRTQTVPKKPGGR